MFDIVIIGGGIVGTTIARNLMKYKLKVALLEKEADVALGATKANSGIVHGGYAGKHGTLKGELCVKGNRLYDQLEKELNFGFKRIGGMILGFDEKDRTTLENQMKNGILVGQTEFEWLDYDALRVKEPHISDKAKFALFMPDIGIVSPYEMAIAMVENAVKNGLELKLNHKVDRIEKKNGYQIHTNKGVISSKIVINAAGLDSGRLNDSFNDELKILPRRGQYVLFGKDQSHLVNHVIFQPPTDKGKGILVTQTVHGNFMVGPDAEDLMDEIQTETSSERLEQIIKLARHSIPEFKIKRALTTFSGIRAMSETKDFYIKMVDENMITVGGIDSPGLTSAPAIAEYVIKMINNQENLALNPDFNPIRPSYFEEDKGKIICQCEQQSETVIEKCFNGPIEVKTLDGVKRRVRAGMGNCQGMRCGPVIKAMIEEKYHINDVQKRTESTQPNRVSIQVIRNLKV